MFGKIRRVLHPSSFQGKKRKAPYFEGWYYKLVDSKEEYSLAVIPGVQISPLPENSHAFIQIFEGRAGIVDYKIFPLSVFSSKDRLFDIGIGPNHFCADALRLNVEGKRLCVSGELEFHALKPWPVTFRSPGIMGWYAWIPFMECFHGVVSLDHEIKGRLTVNSLERDFTGGRGYTEKDWGKSFPDAWVWFQTNHFSHRGTSLTASIAIIPWVRRPFPGFIIGLWHENKLYRFASYTGAKVTHLKISDTQIAWTVQDRHFSLEMFALREKGGLLHAPSVAGMDRRITETLDSTVKIRLTALDKKDYRTIIEDSGRNAGLEAAGNLDRLIEMWKAEKID